MVIMSVVNWLLKKLLIYKFKHQQLCAWCFGIDERADIDVLLEIDGIQGTRIPAELINDYFKGMQSVRSTKNEQSN